ncbi:MAG: polysaccharide biosynthesis protein [Bacteroidaceae bacterium]|nr:polysaccharide biosynthesis protein [Bacteroidaceae bacterium]
MKLKIGQIEFLSSHLIWVVDSCLSVISTLFIYLLFSYTLGINIDGTLMRNMVILSIVTSFLYTRICKTHQGIIRHTTVAELTRLVYAMFLKAVTFLILAHVTLEYVGRFIYTLIFADFICSIFLQMFMRALIVNFYIHVIHFTSKPKYNIFIYGTSRAAVGLANYLRGDDSQYKVKGFLTRNRSESSLRIMGYPILYLNTTEDIEKALKHHKVDTILFANADDLHGNESLTAYSLEHDIALRIAPMVEAGDNSASFQLRNVQIEDLLGRDEIIVNMNKLKEGLTNRIIMVTGAAGSIGSEICRQLCSFKPQLLILFDFSETATYEINMELRKNFPDVNIQTIIGDVRDQVRVESQISRYRPHMIFHAAAYKHVPLMEEHPCEAVHTNIGGTRIVAEAAIRYNVEKFVMISTDKAVRPSNVMGATKRLAEMYVQSLGTAIKEGTIQGNTSFITTRFGNVLGSNGSVIPLFRKQIEAGGPITVTHPDIIRYFMTIPEACRLVLEAAFLGEGNDIFIFDMGKPVRIVDLAKKMISLSGLRQGIDIKIKYTGLRPGEKLYEELLYQKENTLPTDNPKIFRAQTIRYEHQQIREHINRLLNTAYTYNKLETVRFMKHIDPEFKSQSSIYESLDAEEKKTPNQLENMSVNK